MKIKSLSIFIFLYNEAENIQQVIENTALFLKNHVEDAELIVINDGSSDNSKEVLTDLQKNYQFTLINHETNLGIGHALKNGYQVASKDFVVGVPGDGQFDVMELLEIKEWNFDRFYSFYREQKGYNWYRNSLTQFNLLLNRLFLKNSLKDVNWIKVYSKNQIAEANPELNSSLIESEISSKLIKRGYIFEEISSTYLPRNSGVPKGGNIKTVSKAFIEMFHLVRIVRKF